MSCRVLEGEGACHAGYLLYRVLEGEGEGDAGCLLCRVLAMQGACHAGYLLCRVLAMQVLAITIILCFQPGEYGNLS